MLPAGVMYFVAFLYETHLHTAEGSKCSHEPAVHYIAKFLDAGFTGIFVTDHFTGYCPVPDPALPWREWVDAYCLGYEHAAEEGCKRGLQVFFGWEQTCQSDEYLVYGLDKQWLYEHPECRTWTRREMYDTVSAYGGCVVHAHPFRERGYIDYVRLYPECCHAIEIANKGNEPYMDVLAARYAKALHLPMTAGSDIHGIGSDFAPYGVETEVKLQSAKHYAQLIRSGQGVKPYMPKGRTEEPQDAKNTLRVACYDRNDQERPLPGGFSL